MKRLALSIALIPLLFSSAYAGSSGVPTKLKTGACTAFTVGGVTYGVNENAQNKWALVVNAKANGWSIDVATSVDVGLGTAQQVSCFNPVSGVFQVLPEAFLIEPTN